MEIAKSLLDALRFVGFTRDFDGEAAMSSSWVRLSQNYRTQQVRLFRLERLTVLLCHQDAGDWTVPLELLCDETAEEWKLAESLLEAVE